MARRYRNHSPREHKLSAPYGYRAQLYAGGLRFHPQRVTPNRSALKKSVRTRPRPVVTRMIQPRQQLPVLVYQTLREYRQELHRLTQKINTARRRSEQTVEIYRAAAGVSLTHTLNRVRPRLRAQLSDFLVGIDLALALAPVVGDAFSAAINHLAATHLRFVPEQWRQQWERNSSLRAAAVIEEMQHIYFDRVWLDRLTMRALTTTAGGLAWVLRATLHLQLRLEKHWRPRRVPITQRRIDEIPTEGYRAFMKGNLMIGQALGIFRGGAGQVHLLMADGVRQVLPEHFSRPKLRRPNPPRSGSDALADIDELYWAQATGSVIKVVRVGVKPGSSKSPRWIVVVPGTDHSFLESNRNPADAQTNLKEALGIPSTIRQGVLRAMLDAMEQCGIVGEQVALQQVLLVGHSQGGLVNSNLAAQSDLPFRVAGLLSAGAPIGRAPVMPGVVEVTLRHEQDVIHVMDGCNGYLDSAIVLLTRSLEKPKRGPLFYAHSAGTYVETARLMEHWAQEEPNSRVGQACAFLNDFFPEGDEPCRVFFYQITQEVLPPAGFGSHEYTPSYLPSRGTASSRYPQTGAGVSFSSEEEIRV